MTNEEIIIFIRDQMLTNPNISADFVYSVANKATVDNHLFYLMNRWMEASLETEKFFIEQDILKYLNNL